MQAEHRAHLFAAAQLELAQAAPLFDPAKHLLDAAAGIDRIGVALVAGVRPSIAEPPGRAVFWATCGVTPMRRISATNPLVL